MGITFSVCGHSAGTEKVWPFDIIPRIVEVEGMESDPRRARAADHSPQPVHRRYLRHGLDLKDRVIPEELLHSAKCFLDPCMA